MHFRTHPKPESVGQAGRWQSPYHDTMIDHDGVVGAAARPARRARSRRRHDRDLQHRQRAAQEHVARRRHDAVPQREEHELGRCVPGPGDDPLAGQDPRRCRLERDRSAPRLAADVPRRRGRARHRREAQGGPQIGEKTYKVHIDGFNLLPYLTGEVDRARARASSTSPTTATCSPSASTTGRSSSWSSASGHDADLGRAVRRRCACRSSSTCAPTRSSGPTSRRTPTATGCSTTPSSSWPRPALVAQFLATFKEFPPRQEAASFTIDQAVEKLDESA